MTNFCDKPVVVIAGATGYVGSHLAWKLASQGLPVRCLVRPEAKKTDTDFLASLGVDVIKASLAEPDTSRALTGARVAVHLIGSIAPSKGESLEELHVQNTKHFVEMCKMAGIGKIVMVSALGSGPRALSCYHRTKWQAEECVRQSGLEYIILRPSLIVGHLAGLRDSKLIRRYLDIIASGRLVPLVNGGINCLQPIFIKDLTEALHACIQSNSFGTFELGGANVVTMRQLIEELMRIKNAHKPIIGLPAIIANAIAICCEQVQQVPIISRDQIILASQDNICEHNALDTVFGIQPTSLQDALQTYQVAGLPKVELACTKENQ
ncbi:MAG: NAD(P)H-binding protein [Candidatus Melainabacteria bacterium]|nr:NAD(P)H-binding protein [Candidatus Melainabacteria bacterium]